MAVHRHVHIRGSTCQDTCQLLLPRLPVNKLRSPRFLPCYHTFCLPCLEELAKRHRNTIPCPTCRAPTTVPPGGVSALQVNFYFTEEALEEARSEKRQSMCPVHSKDVAIFHCTQCDKSLCLKCKLTKHEGHTTEELSDTIARCKKTIENELHTFAQTIEIKTQKLESCKQNEKRAQEKRAAVMEQIQVRYEVIVAMAGKYRDQALQELQKTCDDLEKDLAADTKQVEDELSYLLQLQERAQRALRSAWDTEVLQVEREMKCKDKSGLPLTGIKALLSNQTYRPVLHGDFRNYVEDHYMKTFIGSPVKQSFSNKKTVDIIRFVRCGEGGCHEVHALRHKENGSIEVYYGGTGGDYSKEKGVSFSSDGSRGTEVEYGHRVSFVTRKDYIWRWKDTSFCDIGSKNNSKHSLVQNCTTGVSYICLIKQTEGVETYVTDTTLIHPKLHKAHNFDSNEQGTFFAVVDEEEDKNSEDEAVKSDTTKAGCRGSRVVRLYYNKFNNPIATYRKNNFFPTDVCFCGEDTLLIADWMNDCVHVTHVSVFGIRFVCYLPGSGDIVRPTALNLDLKGQLLIGCGDGWVLRLPVYEWRVLAYLGSSCDIFEVFFALKTNLNCLRFWQISVDLGDISYSFQDRSVK